MNNNGKNSRFGFNLQPDLSEYNKKPEPVVEEAEEKVKNENEGEKVSELLKDATVGLVHSTRDLIIYILIWYVCYPCLLFTTFYMSERYLRVKFEEFTPIEALNAFITLCAGVYYAYYLLTTFINEHSDAAMYADEKQYFFQRICYYALYMGFVLYMSNMLNIDTLQSPEVLRLFTIFYILYIFAVTVFRHFNNQVSRPR